MADAEEIRQKNLEAGRKKAKALIHGLIFIFNDGLVQLEEFRKRKSKKTKTKSGDLSQDSEVTESPAPSSQNLTGLAAPFRHVIAPYVHRSLSPSDTPTPNKVITHETPKESPAQVSISYLHVPMRGVQSRRNNIAETELGCQRWFGHKV